MSKRDLFIQFVKDWCYDDSHGYDQAHRDGPNCDCSSLMYMAARYAGYSMPAYNGSTWSMLTDFTNAGWVAVGFDGNLYDCDAGCIALNVSAHTEAFIGDGCFGGAHIDENGNIANGQSGDQTGNEVSICPVYKFNEGWDYILIPPDECDGEVSQPAASEPAIALPFYRGYTLERSWLDWMNGLKDDGGSGDDFAGVYNEWLYDIEFRDGTLGPGGWWQLVLMDGTVLGKNQRNDAHEQAVRGVIVYYSTPDPASTGWKVAYYQVHPVGCDWLKWERDDQDGGAGDDVHPLDAFRCTLAAA